MARGTLASLAIMSLATAWAAAADDQPASPEQLFARDNLVAWCIVPFDAKGREPEERAAMLQRLGFTKFAYDWRAEHLPTFDAEIDALERHGVELTAVWFPAALDRDALFILETLKRHNTQTQLWITMGDPAPESAEQSARVAAAASALRPVAEAAAAQGCTIGLYNHGGWFGQPENQLAIIKSLNLPNVGVVYNLHHGHEHLDRFAQCLEQLKPLLYAVNLNGMDPAGDAHGRKILALGRGKRDLELLRQIAASGYDGPIGVLGHTQDDAEARLQDNLDGLEWLVKQFSGKPASDPPALRTPAAGE